MEKFFETLLTLYRSYGYTLVMVIEDRGLEGGAMTTTIETTQNLRWYVRCEDCLSVSVVERPDVPKGVGFDAKYREQRRHCEARDALDGATCGACGGKIEIMGRVQSSNIDRLISGAGDRCLCNELCACARGPKCSCKCGGEHHGTGMVAFVETIHESAKPKITPPKAVATAKVRAEEYRALLAVARARIDSMPGRSVADRKRDGAWVGNEDFALYRAWEASRRDLSEVRALRTHKGRMARLARLVRA